MTNFKKSFGVLAVGLLALTFCCVLIAQSALAKSESRVTQSTPYYEQGTVPLPGTDDVAIETKAPKKEPRNVEQPATLQASELATAPPRTPRPEVATSVMQGGDTYGTATVITGPGSYAGTTVGYNHDYDATLCGSPNLCPDVVYSYTPAVNAFIDLSLCNSGGTDTKLWVVEATGMTEIQCNDDGDDCPGYESHITTFAITAGTTYYFVIGGWGDTDAGPYVLDVTEYVEGIDCQAAYQIEFDPGDGEDDDSQDYLVDLSGGGPNSTIGAPNCLFYEFTAEATGFYNFSWTADENVPIAYLTGLAGSIVCDEGAYALDYGVTAGPWITQAVMLENWTYIMEPFDWGEGQTGVITISRVELPSLNDECVDAEDLGVGNGYHFVHNVNSTLSPGFDYTWCDPVIDPGTQTCGDVWYTWEADQTGYVLFDMCWYGDSWDSKMFVYRGYSCNGDEVIDPFGCSDDGCGKFGDGGLIEMECTAGEVFTIRVAGWISGDGLPDATCALEGAMGTGHMDIYQDVVSIRPENSNCPDVTPAALAPGGDVFSRTGSLDLSGWGACPDMYNTPDGSIGIGGAMAWMVFDGFSISECSDIRVDYCGTQDNNPGRVNYSNWPQGINVFTGCPCEGPFVTIPTSGGTYTGVCDPLIYTDAGADFSRGWDWFGLLPGTYYFPTSVWYLGISSTGGAYIPPYDFTVNVRSTPVPCEYCDATANINSCPPVAGASWIQDVNFVGISTSATGCNAYEDHTDLVASLYKGISYDLSVLMGKVGIAGEHDSCDAWIDWNQNSGFAAFVPEINEKVDLSRLALTWTATVTPPLDAAEPGEGATGVTIMRIRMASDADGANVPCGEKVWGEVEDFTVEVSSIECGDFDIDGMIDADDIAFLRDWYFGGGTAPDYWQRADIDGDGMITLADVIGLVDAAYFGGSAICIN